MKTKNLLIGTTLLLAAAAPATYAEFTLGLDLIKDSGTRDVDYQFKYNNGNTTQYPSDSYSSNSTGFRLRLGLGTVADRRAEVYLSRYSLSEDGAFAKSGTELEAGVNYIIPFAQNNKAFNPFVKVGIGIGNADTDFTFSDGSTSIKNVHLNLGGGLSYSINKQLSVTGGLEYVYRNWQDIEVQDYYGTGTISISDSVYRLAIGVDFGF